MSNSKENGSGRDIERTRRQSGSTSVGRDQDRTVSDEALDFLGKYISEDQFRDIVVDRVKQAYEADVSGLRDEIKSVQERFHEIVIGGQSELSDEIRKLRGRFQEVADGEASELRNEIRSIRERFAKTAGRELSELRSEVRSLRDGFPVKDHAIEALTITNEKLRDKMEAEWRWPKIAFSCIGGVLGLFFALNLAHQWYVASDIAKKSEDLDVAIRKFNALEQGVQSLQSEAAELRLKAASQLEFGVEATVVANNVAALVALGHHRLKPNYEPRQASYYASKAQNELDILLNRYSKDADTTKLLDPLKLPILHLGAEGAWEEGRPKVVEEIAKEMQSLDADCAEANYLLGIASLHQASGQKADIDDRAHLRALAVEYLNRASNRLGDGAVVQIFLAAALYDDGRYDDAAACADQFLRVYPEKKEQRKLLPSDIQAYIVIADAWRVLAIFKSGRSEEALFPGPECDSPIRGLRKSDGVVFERLFHHASQSDENETVSEFGKVAVNFIQGATGCEAAPAAETPEPTAAPAAPEAPAA